MRDTEREAGSAQEASRGAQSQDPRIICSEPKADVQPLSHPCAPLKSCSKKNFNVQ